MSLTNFSKLFADLDSNNSINEKINILTKYFSSNTSLENASTIFLLLGKSNKRYISGKKLRIFFIHVIYEIERICFGSSFNLSLLFNNVYYTVYPFGLSIETWN